MPEKSYAHGEYTGLARDYSQYRPGYSEAVLSCILSLLEKPESGLDVVDVGAGTGIFTRLIAGRDVRNITAIEPNDDMRKHGIDNSEGMKINWKEGSGEATGMPDQCADLVSMASSFHWVDFENGTKEFHRILKNNGCFVALWNPRHLEANPLLLEIEDHLSSIKTDIKRVSSGLSGLTEKLTDMLWESPYFEDVVYIEGRHDKIFTPEEYIGVWRSVNDLRVQLGQKGFDQFIDYVKDRIIGHDLITANYLTRAWIARKR